MCRRRISDVPTGLGRDDEASPAMNRWANFECPYGARDATVGYHVRFAVPRDRAQGQDCGPFRYLLETGGPRHQPNPCSMKPNALIRRLVPILHEDERLLIVDKPAGVDTGGLTKQPVAGVAEILAGLRGPTAEFHPVSRLSRYESGVLLLAKDSAAAQALRARLRGPGVSREYVAVVRGSLKKPRLTVGAEHGTSRGKGKRSGARGDAPISAGSSTAVQILRQGERRSLVRCRTSLENTHMLRAQLRSVGLRLVGDHVHDQSRQPARQELTCLHLTRLVIEDWLPKTKLTASTPAPDAFDGVLQEAFPVERALHAALVRRLPVVADTGTDAYRLLTGEFEDLPGLSAERYGDVAILQVLGPIRDEASVLRRAARWYVDVLGVGSVYVKHFVKDRPAADGDISEALRSPKPLLGRAAPEQVEIRERGLKFVIRPHDGFSVGLFLDHRDNRSRVRSLAAGKDVLNLFAYTCGFSVAGAAGGARSTVSVDVSPKNLEWGRENFALNGLGLDAHTFVKSDAADYLRRAARQGKRFDLIVLDPPTFAHGRKRGQAFSVERDLADLVQAAAGVLSCGGVMMVSTNYRKLTWRNLREQVKRGAGKRPHRVMESPPLPVDFAADSDHAKTMFVQFDGPHGDAAGD